MEQLFGGPWLPEAERWQFDLRHGDAQGGQGGQGGRQAGGANASSARAEAEESARACLHVAAACMKHGNRRLLALVLAVLPPLQREQAPRCAAEAVEAVLFERCGPLLQARSA